MQEPKVFGMTKEEFGALEMGGKCCFCFYLPYTPEELELVYKNGQLRDGNDNNTQKVEYIMDMLIPYSDAPNWYTCKYYNEESCSAYESRPNMCRGFPKYKNEEKLCESKNCTTRSICNGLK